MNDRLNYDIIPDIHGRFDKLANLMERMGYQPAGEGFIPPPGHMAVFLGDLIDTKPGLPFPGGIRATLRAVKAMCDRGDALCLMGNHEQNAICFHTNGPDGNPLRNHSKRRLGLHQGTLDDFPDHADPASEWRTVWLPWLRSLPIFLDLPGFRAVHACWQPGHLSLLAGKSLSDDDFLFACADKRSPEGMAIEAVLKGIEIPLPEGHYFTDHTGMKHKQFRARWWDAPPPGHRFNDLVFPPSGQECPIPLDPWVGDMFHPYPVDARPVFFGHYYKSPGSLIRPERHNVACLDYSAAAGGPLVAYRWKGDACIYPEHYVLHS